MLTKEKEDRAIRKAMLILEKRVRDTAFTIADPDTVRKYVCTMLGCARDREEFWCIYLDSQHKVLTSERTSVGTIDAASVYPREVLKSVLNHQASAVVFVHNHPSGVPDPSAADRALTDRLRQSLALIDVRVLDHIVVGHNVTTSFAQSGWI